MCKVHACQFKHGVAFRATWPESGRTCSWEFRIEWSDLQVFGFLNANLVSNLVGTRVDTCKWMWTHYFEGLPRQIIDTVRFQTCLVDYVC